MMAAQSRTPKLPSEHAKWTYRYLRIAMIGAVAVIAISIGIERSKVECWQTSISAYYYTPVRAIFVGAMLAVSLALIAYKGKGLEDTFLNFAGMLAPIVAVAPTTDVGLCWSTQPFPLPVNDDGSLAGWAAANIDNNVHALLFVGLIGLIVSTIVKIRKLGRGTRIALIVTASALLFTWWLMETWDDFNTRAHGYSALLLFIFLILAIVANVVKHWAERSEERSSAWSWIYMTIAALMVVGALTIWLSRYFEDHTVLVLEAYEIVLFALYWIAQTVENWPEQVKPNGSGNDIPATDTAATETQHTSGPMTAGNPAPERSPLRSGR
jgi:cytochrome bd-type quinol oxidase subunit 2